MLSHASPDQEIGLDDLLCTGSESRLVNCFKRHNCGHFEDATVACTHDGTLTLYDYFTTSTDTIICVIYMQTSHIVYSEHEQRAHYSSNRLHTEITTIILCCDISCTCMYSCESNTWRRALFKQ